MQIHAIVVSHLFVFFFQAEDGIRDLVRSRGLGDVYKRQSLSFSFSFFEAARPPMGQTTAPRRRTEVRMAIRLCLLYTSDAADERSSVDLGGRRIIKKKNREYKRGGEHNNAKIKEKNARAVS